MKKIYFSLIIFGLILAACQLKQNYTMQYGFSNEIITASQTSEAKDGFKIELPFADFSCDAKSFKAVLNRKENNFTITLNGVETQERCSQKFFAEVAGIKQGDYWLKIIYQKNQEEILVFSEALKISNN
ncbi:MAG TPA: hypothetical protein VJG65_02430 [Patescibacteria group bacterium]|nr:hypothetical protein [Patescibacteria group bacterium]